MSCQSLESVNHFSGLSAAFIALFAQKKSIFSSSLPLQWLQVQHTAFSLDLMRPCAAVLKLIPGVLTGKKRCRHLLYCIPGFLRMEFLITLKDDTKNTTATAHERGSDQKRDKD